MTLIEKLENIHKLVQKVHMPLQDHVLAEQWFQEIKSVLSEKQNCDLQPKQCEGADKPNQP